MKSKLKKLSPTFKTRVKNAAELMAIGGMLAISAHFAEKKDYLQPNKIIKPCCLIEEAAIVMFQDTTLKLEYIDHDYIRVNNEVLFNEYAMEKYPKDRKAISAFVQYNWYQDEKKQKAQQQAISQPQSFKLKLPHCTDSQSIEK